MKKGCTDRHGIPFWIPEGIWIHHLPRKGGEIRRRRSGPSCHPAPTLTGPVPVAARSLKQWCFHQRVWKAAIAVIWVRKAKAGCPFYFMLGTILVLTHNLQIWAILGRLRNERVIPGGDGEVAPRSGFGRHCFMCRHGSCIEQPQLRYESRFCLLGIVFASRRHFLPISIIIFNLIAPGPHMPSFNLSHEKQAGL